MGRHGRVAGRSIRRDGRRGKCGGIEGAGTGGHAREVVDRVERGHSTGRRRAVLHVWRAVAAAVVVVEARVLRVLRVHTRLLDTSGGRAIGVLVDGCLKLLEEAVNVLQVVLRPGIGQG